VNRKFENLAAGVTALPGVAVAGYGGLKYLTAVGDYNRLVSAGYSGGALIRLQGVMNSAAGLLVVGIALAVAVPLVVKFIVLPKLRQGRKTE